MLLRRLIVGDEGLLVALQGEDHAETRLELREILGCEPNDTLREE